MSIFFTSPSKNLSTPVHGEFIDFVGVSFEDGIPTQKPGIMMVATEISEFLNKYFEVLQTQDMALFDSVFHKDCVLYSQQDGALVVRPYAAYRQMVQGRAAPAASNSPREEEILMFDMLSPSMATVKVRLRLFNNIMEDHLNLMKHDGRWMIYAKHFHHVGSVGGA